MATVSEFLGDQRRPEAIFTVRKLKYGGYEVLMEGNLETPRRHVCDFRSEYEAKIWIKENSPPRGREMAENRD